jgi:hypothetical protein
MGDPSNLLVFADDTGFQAEPRRGLPALQAWVGVVVDPVQYLDLKLQVGGQLLRHGVPELHAADIRSPKTTSPWDGRPIDERHAVLASISGMAPRWVERFYSLALFDHQHAWIRRTISEVNIPNWARFTSHKGAAEFMFFSLLRQRLAVDYPGRTVVIVADDSYARSSLRSIFRKGSGVFGEGVHYMSSKAVRGLQVADLVAYALGRVERLAQTGEKQGPFDPVLTKLASDLRPRGHDLRRDLEARRTAARKPRRSRSRGGRSAAA